MKQYSIALILASALHSAVVRTFWTGILFPKPQKIHSGKQRLMRWQV